MRQRDVLANGVRQEQTLAATIRRHVDQPGSGGGARVADRHIAPVDGDATGRGQQSEQRARDLLLTRSLHATETEDFPGPHRKRDLRPARDAQAGVQHDGTGRGGAGRVGEGDVAADHHADQACRIGLLRGQGADHLAVLQHRDPVGQRHHLDDAVGDEHDGGALRAQAAQQREQTLGLGGGECRGWLVQDQHPGIPRQRPCDFQDLRLGAPEFTHRPPQIDLLAERGQHRGTVAQHPCPIHQRASHRFAAKKEIARPVQLRHQARVLVHHRDALRESIAGRVDPHAGTVHADLARIGAIDAGQDAHERRFAGAVLADQRVDFAGTDVERDRVQGADAGEAFRDPDDRQDRISQRSSSASRHRDWCPRTRRPACRGGYTGRNLPR